MTTGMCAVEEQYRAPRKANLPGKGKGRCPPGLKDEGLGRRSREGTLVQSASCFPAGRRLSHAECCVNERMHA